MAATFKSSAWIVIFVTLSSVTAQTFQYSRGWINGKRSDQKTEDARDVASNLERILTPCQMTKLKYVLDGKPLNDKFFAPCDYVEDDTDSKPKHYNIESQHPLYEVFL